MRPLEINTLLDKAKRNRNKRKIKDGPSNVCDAPVASKLLSTYSDYEFN